MIESHERVEQFKQEIADMKVRDPVDRPRPRLAPASASR